MIQNGFAKRLLGGVAMILGVIVLLSLLRWGLAVYLYSAVATWATTQLGLDYYPAEFLGVAFSSFIMFFLPGFGSLILSRQKRFASAALVVGGYLLVCVLVYSVGRNTYFDQTTGNPLRYYAETPDGIVFSFLPGYDPKWGIERKPYTRQAAQELLRRKQLADEQQRKIQLEAQKRLEDQRRAEEARLLRQQELETKRQEAEAKRQYEIEQQRLMAESARQQREYETQQAEEQRQDQRQQAEAERQDDLEQQRHENQRLLEEQKIAAERERERRIEQQRKEAEEQEKQEQIAYQERDRQSREEQQQQERAAKKREAINRAANTVRNEIERKTGKRIPWPF